MISKKRYAIIGKPVSHSMSPILHNYWFNKYNISAEYSLMEIDEVDLDKVVKKVRDGVLNGVNITLPYKKKIIPFLDKLIHDAEKTSSVNTLYLNKENEVVGDNTDVFGLMAGYFKNIIDKKNKNQKALILGAGGLSPSVIFALQKSDVLDITLVNRTYEKSTFLKNKFKEITIMKWNDIQNSTHEFDIIINATSLGLKNYKDFNFIIERFKKSLVYIDTIYNPLETKMMKHLKSNNIKTYGGLDMFIYQGQKSFYLWSKINPEINDELLNLLSAKLK
ncbi:shikimate dehydrogenase [Pelagibacteraceae bacterium]|jgi:shikimate dehydrogenase|nr:shikimate dehydrogenase [Pelagibacteraceae bacterium]|tara:strand:+ start:234 stop:1067 length:834 start_codon:yes stop_codon:yes gene_type:complete